MKFYTNWSHEKGVSAGNIEHVVPPRPVLPHERKNILRIEFDESEWGIFKEVFGDEDTAFAAMEIIEGAPPEIQILVIQLLDIIKEVA